MIGLRHDINATRQAIVRVVHSLTSDPIEVASIIRQASIEAIEELTRAEQIG